MWNICLSPRKLMQIKSCDLSHSFLIKTQSSEQFCLCTLGESPLYCCRIMVVLHNWLNAVSISQIPENLWFRFSPFMWTWGRNVWIHDWRLKGWLQSGSRFYLATLGKKQPVLSLKKITKASFKMCNQPDFLSRVVACQSFKQIMQTLSLPLTIFHWAVGREEGD